MKAALEASLLAEIKLFSHEIKLPTVGRECGPTADQIRRARDDPLLLVYGQLAAEHQDRGTRRASRRAKEAHFPLLKTVEGNEFRCNPTLDEGRIRALASCEFARNGEPVLLVGGTGTGKTHLAIALAHAACALGLATRFSTTAALVKGGGKA